MFLNQIKLIQKVYKKPSFNIEAKPTPEKPQDIIFLLNLEQFSSISFDKRS